MENNKIEKEITEWIDKITQDPKNWEAYDKIISLYLSLSLSLYLRKACDYAFQAVTRAQADKNEEQYKFFKEKRSTIKDKMREQYKNDSFKRFWEDIEDFIADNHEILDEGNTEQYIKEFEQHMQINTISENYKTNPYLELYNSVVNFVPPRYMQPKTFALTDDLKKLPEIIFEDRKKKGKWPSGLEKQDIMDDFNDNYICFNGLIVPRDYLLFFKYIRTPMTHYFSWAIPNENSLKTIQSFGPIVEIGAGSGYLYWANLLRKRGVDVVALDLFPPSLGSNPSHKTFHTDIQHGEPKDLNKYDDRTLLLCWPDDYHSANKQMYTFAADCLSHFKGKYIIYIGDWKGTALGASEYGYTSSREFQDNLQSQFTKIQRVLIPNWPMVADDLTVWERK